MPRLGLNTARVVAEAARLADEEGLEALTLARLAGVLNVRVPSLYKHIDSLSDLHRRLALVANTTIAARIRDVAVGLAGEDALRVCCHAYRDFAKAHPGQYAAAQRAPDPRDPDQVALHRAGEEITALAQGVLRSYQLTGEDSIHAARMLRSALHGFVALEQLGGFGLAVNVDTSFEWLVDVLATALRAIAARGQARPNGLPGATLTESW